MKDLLISLSSNFVFKDLKPWINSFNKVNSTAEKWFLLFNCDKDTVRAIEESGFKIISPVPRSADGSYQYNSQVHMNVERFGHFWTNLRNKKNNFRYILAADSRDMIFQKDPFEYIHKTLSENLDKNYIASSEAVKYKDETFWSAPNFYHSFGPSAFDHIQNRIVYNCGTIAGRADNIIDLFCFIFFMSINNTVPNPDQAAYNFILSQEPFKSMTYFSNYEDGWAAQIGTAMQEKYSNIRIEPTPIWKNNKLFSANDKEYYLLHQYDKIKDIIDFVNKEYYL